LWWGPAWGAPQYEARGEEAFSEKQPSSRARGGSGREGCGTGALLRQALSLENELLKKRGLSKYHSNGGMPPDCLPQREPSRGFPITFITRLRLDAALYEPAPPRHPGQMGRPRLKGERLPNLSVIAEDPFTVWKAITVTNWYGKEKRTVETVSDSAVWHSSGSPAVPLCGLLRGLNG
jgi:hypothetical protein